MSNLLDTLRALPHPDLRTRREHIAAEISGLVADFLYYDRKGCESLPGPAIQEAVAARELTIAEMVDLFAKLLRDSLEEPA